MNLGFVPMLNEFHHHPTMIPETNAERDQRVYRQDLNATLISQFPDYLHARKHMLKVVQENVSYHRSRVDPSDYNPVFSGIYELTALGMPKRTIHAVLKVDYDVEGYYNILIEIQRDVIERDMGWINGRPNLVRRNKDGTIKRGPPNAAEVQKHALPQPSSRLNQFWLLTGKESLELDRQAREERRQPNISTSTTQMDAVPQNSDASFITFLAKYKEIFPNLSDDELNRNARAFFEHWGKC